MLGRFYGHLANFTAIWYILCPFGIFCSYYVYFLQFWYIVPRKSGNPAAEPFTLAEFETAIFNFNWEADICT
jgi:hypothetical protein